MYERACAYETQRHRQLKWDAAAAFADHAIVESTAWSDGAGAQWTLRKPGTGIFAVQIIAGICGSLIVHGDIDTARFGHYSDHRDAVSRLHWMASHEDCDSYVRQKASIGLHAGNGGSAYDEEYARALLKDQADEAREGGDSKGEEMFRDALGYTESEIELHYFLASRGHYECESYRLVQPHVVYAHQALRRLMFLLEGGDS